jgi:integrase
MAQRKTPKKRGSTYGLGTKYQRGKIWWVKIYNGKNVPIRKSTKSENEADADDLLGQMLRERSRGELVAIDSSHAYTLGDVLEDYLAHRKRLASGTLATYRCEVDNLLKPYFGLLPPAKLTTDMLSDYRDKRAKECVVMHNGPNGEPKKLKRLVSETTINRELGLLRSALRDMAKRRPKLIPSLPYFPMESERDNVRQGFVTEEEFITKLLPELPRHLRALGACAFYCGGRKSEWLRVDWADVDFGAMVIRFAKAKNKHPREVPIVPGAMLDCLLESLKVASAAWPDEPAVFVYDGNRMATVGDAWDKACERAGFRGLLFHDMRRSANKNMRDHSVGQNTRMQIMGHLTPSMDIRYGIVDLNDIQQAGDKMSEKLPAKLKRVK